MTDVEEQMYRVLLDTATELAIVSGTHSPLPGTGHTSVGFLRQCAKMDRERTIAAINASIFLRRIVGEFGHTLKDDLCTPA